MRIKDVYAREIIDSRGNPTVEVDLTLESGQVITASVPSGASTGDKEALELRDNDKGRYDGKGVLMAVSNINGVIKNKIVGMELNQRKIDNALIELDGTFNKSKLGANAILAVSLAVLKAGAVSKNQELYHYVSNGRITLPIPMVNILNGGVHASNNIDIQEFMIVPVIKTFKERLRAACEVFHALKKILKRKNLSVAVGDEGGFAPDLPNTRAALDILVEAIKEAGYVPGRDVYLALDVAASSFYDEQEDLYLFEGEKITGEKLVSFYKTIVNEYPIISIEDAFSEFDIKNMQKLTELIGHKMMLVGDDYFVTNKQYLEDGIRKRYNNTILLKANQVGTISEMCDTIRLAYVNDFKMIISHRSGETLDTFIADLACGLNIQFIKTGSVCRGERVAKYNRLLKIEEDMLRRNH